MVYREQLGVNWVKRKKPTKFTSNSKKILGLIIPFQELLKLVHQAAMLKGNNAAYTWFGRMSGRINLKEAMAWEKLSNLI